MRDDTENITMNDALPEERDARYQALIANLRNAPGDSITLSDAEQSAILARVRAHLQWQARQPESTASTTTANTHTTTRTTRKRHPIPLAARSARRSISKGLREPMDTPTTPTRARWRAAAAALAAVVVVGALATLLVNNAQQRDSHTGGKATATNTPAAPVVTQISSAENGVVTYPILVPSDPSVMYRVIYDGTIPPHGSISPQISTDGGKTFHTLPTPEPITAPNYTNLTFWVSPTSTSYVALVVVAPGQTCATTAPTAMTPTIQSKSSVVTSAALSVGRTRLSGEPPPLPPGELTCAQSFYSVNRGQTWRRLDLPGDSVLSYNDRIGGALNFYGSSAFQAQGTRLYASVIPSVVPAGGALENAPTERILTSADGGVTWSYADTSLADSDAFICDFAAAPTGSTLYAVVANQNCSTSTKPAALYRSDNGGQSWTKVNTLPGRAEAGLLVSRAGALYTFTPPVQIHPVQPGGSYTTETQTAQYALVSLDGGATFQHAPDAGLPPESQQMLFGPLGILSDGSVLYVNQPYGGDATFITWKPGATSWTQVASIDGINPADQSPIVLVSPSAQGGDTLTIEYESLSLPYYQFNVAQIHVAQ